MKFPKFLALLLAATLLLPAGQKIIADFGKGKHGEGLYRDAAYARQYDE